MQVKDRIIFIEKDNNSLIDGNYYIIIDEYGIEGKKIYHRRIAISDDIYKEFERNPDDKIHLDEYLQYKGIDSKWKRYELTIPRSDNKENEVKSSFRLFEDIELDKVFNEDTKLNDQTKERIYEMVYNDLLKKETLINNPLVLNVFNEALKRDPELAIWESVFPFFR